MDLSFERCWLEPYEIGNAKLYHANCFDWIDQQHDCSIHAVVTDPPYGLHEYTAEQQAKLRAGLTPDKEKEVLAAWHQKK